MTVSHKVDSPMHNQSLEKGFAVLGAFSAARRQMSLGQIADAVGISRSSAQRIAFTLENLGYLKKDPYSRRYVLSNRAMSFGCSYLESNTLMNAASPLLAAVNQACDETVIMTEPCDLDMIYVATFNSRKPTSIHMTIGSRIPIYCTSSGRAYLSGQPPADTRRILESSNRVALTSRTELRLEVIEEMVQEAARRGFAYNNEEYALGAMNVAAPVRGSNGQSIASVHIMAPTSRWSFDEMITKLAPMVIECAAAIGKAGQSYS